MILHDPAHIRLAILDDHTLVSASLAAFVHAEAPQCEVVWEGPRAVDLLDALDRGLEADLVLLDVRLGPDNPQASVVAEALADRGVLSLLVTEMHSGAQARAALLAGAADLVPKDATGAEFLDAIRRAAAGETLWTRRAVSILGDTLGPHLSEREMMAVRLYVQGLLITTIARRMGVSENTVNTYLKRVRTKFRQAGKEVNSREQMRSVVWDQGLMESGDA